METQATLDEPEHLHKDQFLFAVGLVDPHFGGARVDDADGSVLRPETLRLLGTSDHTESRA